MRDWLLKGIDAYIRFDDQRKEQSDKKKNTKKEIPLTNIDP